MKQLLFILLFAAATLTTKAQTGNFTFDATGLTTFTGGDSTITITSYQWSAPGTQAGPVIFKNANSQILNATVSVAGSYTFTYIVTASNGVMGTATISAYAYGPVVFHINFAGSGVLKTTLK